MKGEKFCPRHGPYDASLPQCPYCALEGRHEAPSGAARSRPPEPTPLDADEISPSRGWMDGAPAFPVEEGRLAATFAEEGDLLRMDEEDQPPAGDAFTEDDAVERTVILGNAPQPPDEETLLGIFWVKSGPHRGEIHRLRHGAMIGRRQGQVRLADPTVSDPHAKVTLEDGHFVLWDFGSANGTYVNGRRIREATPLKEGDEIRFGNTVVVLKVLE